MPDETTPTAPSDLSTWGDERQRTIAWRDPHKTALAGLQLSGLQYVKAMADGSLPGSPISQLVGILPVSAEAGDVVFRCIADESFYNPVGIVHGSLVCALLDSATASAVHTLLPAGVGFTTVDIAVSYLRAVHAGEELTTHGWVTKPGSRICFAEADVTNAQGKIVAKASSSILVLRAEPGP
jgi:uncharacterized protein (TIGR00369 family)